MGQNSSNTKANLKNLITLARICGFIQTDGHISFGMDKDKTLNPRIIITQAESKRELLVVIKEWLYEKFQVNSNLSPANAPSPSVNPNDETKQQRGVNLTIDRQNNCLKLMKEIKSAEKEFDVPFLFDKKRLAFNLVFKALHLRTIVKKTVENAQIYHINQFLKEEKPGTELLEKLTPEELARRLGLDFTTLNKQAATALIEEAKEEVQATGKKAVNDLDPNNIKSTLAEFIMGVIDGDGSFQVNFLTHVPVDDNKNRRIFEIQPLISVTGYKGESEYLYEILYKALVDPHYKKTVVCPEIDVKADRLLIKGLDAFKTFAIPLVKKYKLCLDKNLPRFEIFCEAVENLPRFYKDKAYAIEFVTRLYEISSNYRKKSLSEYIEIIEKHFTK
jgi:hypothetical protein